MGKIKHFGGPMPVDAKAAVRPFYRGPADEAKGVRIRVAPAIRLDWSHDGGPDDIVAYEVINLPPAAQAQKGGE